MPTRRAAAILFAVGLAADAHAVRVLTLGKVAVFRRAADTASAMLRFGKDPALASLVDVTCAGGGTMTLQVASYPQATVRVDAQDVVPLPCEHWRKGSGGFVYRDPGGASGGVRRVVYGNTNLVIQIAGGTYRHVAGPVGYAEVLIGVDGLRLMGRFHNFRRNDADLVVARRPSNAAAAGEAAFWDVLHGVDHSTARQDEAIALLSKAVKRERKDGRSRFLRAISSKRVSTTSRLPSPSTSSSTSST